MSHLEVFVFTADDLKTWMKEWFFQFIYMCISKSGMCLFTLSRRQTSLYLHLQHHGQHQSSCSGFINKVQYDWLPATQQSHVTKWALASLLAPTWVSTGDRPLHTGHIQSGDTSDHGACQYPACSVLRGHFVSFRGNTDDFHWNVS